VTTLEGEEIEYFREKIQVETTVGCLDWFAMLIATAKRGNKGLEGELLLRIAYRGKLFLKFRLSDFDRTLLALSKQQILRSTWPCSESPGFNMSRSSCS